MLSGAGHRRNRGARILVSSPPGICTGGPAAKGRWTRSRSGRPGKETPKHEPNPHDGARLPEHGREDEPAPGVDLRRTLLRPLVAERDGQVAGMAGVHRVLYTVHKCSDSNYCCRKISWRRTPRTSP